MKPTAPKNFPLVRGVTPEGKDYYIQLQAVVEPLVAIVNGMPLQRFKGDKHFYITVNYAVEWTAKEQAMRPSPFNKKRAEIMALVKQQCAEGKFD